MSSQRSSSMESQDNVRKRVCKACDRCRLKKSKCDGASPCSRCKADNAICVFGERKKSQDKVYPKGYVEMLEQQQSQLVAGLRELYRRLQTGDSWPGAPLREAHGGSPLTHDILERLDLLHSSGDGSGNHENFEEDCGRMQQKLVDGGAPYTRRRSSVSSDSDHGHTPASSSTSGTPTTAKSMTFNEAFARNVAPPTPPMHSPFPRQSQLVPSVKQETPMMMPDFMDTGALDPSSLSRTNWTSNSMMMEESLDFSKPMYGFDTYGNFDQNAMLLDPIVVNDPAMPDWNNNADVDFNNFINNQVVT
ncbi:unnamed protein product [Periconia digitata]|uniref:Zn(2)-C6 fungal-type domain-containing protein n=1 Tax=Periconia digitata TaxID=1303443 RepID=A0A9W4XVA5_9PLEO|nr:unnamed protein product [Periconia digitata]